LLVREAHARRGNARGGGETHWPIMRFTSGAAEGPSLDAGALGKLNVGSNVHGSLLSAVNAEQAAAAFGSSGWRVRRYSLCVLKR
jgi:hypothetical protein